MLSPRNRQEFKRLIERYQDGKASPEEIIFVEKYYQSFESVDGFTDNLSETEIQQLQSQLYQKINSGIAITEVKQAVVVPLWRKVAAAASVAAAVLLLVFGGWYLFFQNSPKNVPQQLAINSVKTEILPGKTRATLTLDDGKEIVLDTAQNGLLAEQGNTLIHNSNGTLVYNGVNDGAVRYNTLTTHKGEQYPLTLSDGTEVFVDASSTIRFPVVFNGDQREVSINGRAYFHVAENKSKPFYVVKGDKKVRVYGTQFNVSAYDNEKDMKVTLVQGSVKVMNGASEGMMVPGQQAILAKLNSTINIIDNADIEQAIAWKNGVIAIHHADVSSILQEIERWYDVDIEVIGELPKKDLYFDVSRNAKLSELLRIFEIYHIKYSIDAAKRKLTVNS